MTITKLTPVYAAIDNPGLILLFLILFFGTIALVTLILRNTIPGLKDKRGEINEDIAVQEELDRILEDITDEETLEEMARRKEDEKK